MKATLSRSLLILATAVTVAVSSPTGGPAQAQDATTVFLGTIRYFAFGFAPKGWAWCDGQLLSISQNDTLFALLGTIYGGDGRTTFALPDMRGRFPVHQGTGPGLTNRKIGTKGGLENVALTANQIGHSHMLRATTGAGNQTTPTGNTLAQDGTDTTYRNAAPDVQMNPGAVTSAGSGQAHNNMPPFLGVYCNIALSGIFPSRN